MPRRLTMLPPQQQSDGQGALGVITKLMDRYCLDCHDGADPAAGLSLVNFDTEVALRKEGWNTATWEKIVKRLGARQMPPADSERPSVSEYAAVLTAMESVLDRLAERHPQPGRPDSVRRLNRNEYRNAIRDLLAVDVDVDSMLPADQLVVLSVDSVDAQSAAGSFGERCKLRGRNED